MRDVYKRLFNSVKLFTVNALKCLTVFFFDERGIPVPRVRFMLKKVKNSSFGINSAVAIISTQ